MKQPTPYSEVNSLLDELLSHQQKILRDKLVGLYLYGSLVTGDFDIKISDIDLLCAVSKDITSIEFEKLQEMHTNFAKRHPTWNDRIEVQYLSIDGLQTFKTKPTKMAAISPGDPFHILEANKDWLVNWYIVQEKGIVLFGTDPKKIIDHISTEEFIQIVKNHARSWPEWVKTIPKRRGSQAYAIITLCRAYYSLTHGEQVSKRKAAAWMQQQFPEWASLIQEALQWRTEQWENQTEVPESYDQTVQFVNEISKKIEGINKY